MVQYLEHMDKKESSMHMNKKLVEMVEESKSAHLPLHSMFH